MPAARIGDQTRKKRENGVTRDVVFKMERPGLVEVGQTVEVTESVTPFNVNYMIEPAVTEKPVAAAISLMVALTHPPPMRSDP